MTKIELTDGTLRWFDKDMARRFVVSGNLEYLRTQFGAWVRYQVQPKNYALVPWLEVKRELERVGLTAELNCVLWPSEAELEV